MMMNVLSGAWSDFYILQIIIQQYIEDLTKFFKKTCFQGHKICSQKRDTQKIEKGNCISISAFGYENKNKYQIHMSKKIFSKDMLIFY